MVPLLSISLEELVVFQQGANFIQIMYINLILSIPISATVA
jgi:hypothetical protein